jgi:predicted  nucleic acid-binding Zn-ribbon protein
VAKTLEHFHALEERIAQAIDVIKSTRSDKKAVENELAKTRAEILELQKEVEGLRKRSVVARGRVKGLISSISELTEERLV